MIYVSDTTWRQKFEAARLPDTWSAGDDSDVVAVAPNVEALDVEFYAGFGGSEGPPILIWTEERVYFPVVYDGAEWMESAPRNPTTEPQRHVGGE